MTRDPIDGALLNVLARGAFRSVDDVLEDLNGRLQVARRIDVDELLDRLLALEGARLVESELLVRLTDDGKAAARSSTPLPRPVEAAALDAAGVEDAAVADDTTSRERLWALREGHTEAISAEGVPHKLDVGVPLA